MAFTASKDTGDVVYTGRSKDLARRDRQHDRSKDPAKRGRDFVVEVRTNNRRAQRGAEEIIYTRLRQRGQSGLNRIRPVALRNPNRASILRAGRQAIRNSRYTGSRPG